MHLIEEIKFESSYLNFRYVLQSRSTKNDKRVKEIAKELSDLVVYCRPVPFREDGPSKNLVLAADCKRYLSLWRV